MRLFAFIRNSVPALFESVYEVIMVYELKKRGLIAERQKPMPVMYDNIRFNEAFRSDIVVNGKVIAEPKSVEALLSGSREAGPYAIAPQRTETRSADQLRRSASKEWNQ